jgi:DNA invertase Pin-like site-specific DNA recombinase
MNTSDLIQPRHLVRRAVIYVRQSSPHQVINHQESQRLQRALTQRALELGWQEQDIQVIDADLGITGTLAECRTGFQELVAEVALGKVGILLAYEAQRLARNCTHWYQLLDLCGHTDCLIADRDGVYDASTVNGRLLLGLKGQISELELHLLRGRLTDGILNKAKRGELPLTLPTGLVRLPSREVVKHPDREVQSRVTLIFATLLEKRSLAQVVRFFKEQDLKVPRQDRFGDIHWKRPTVARLGSMVKNPAYAGAFAYGRTRSVRCEKTGKLRQKLRPIEQWKVCIRDKYPAYVSWDTFEKIYAMLRDNYSEYDRNKTRGVPREGKALLQGIVWCGECGHKMVLQYQGGTQYLCNYLRQQHGEPVCQRLPADAIDDQVVHWFFDALSVAEIDVASHALEEADRRRDELFSVRRKEVERLRYQARLADRQYRHADPENRLVTAELEQRWEAALRELKEAEEKLAREEQNTPCWALPVDLVEALRDFGPRLPELWEQGLFDSSQKKALLRSLIDKVVLHRVAPDKVRTRVVWRGGLTTSADVPVHVGRFAAMSDAKEIEEAIVRMAREGQTDQQVAQWLTSCGHRSPMASTVLPSTVRIIRLRHRILIRRNQSHPRRVPGYLTVPQVADKLKVTSHWLYDRIHNGTIRVNKDASTKCYLFPDKPATLRQFRQLLDGKISHVGS